MEEERQREARAHTQYFFLFFFFFCTDEQHAAFFLLLLLLRKVFRTQREIERKTAVSLKGRCDYELVYIYIYNN